MWAIIVEISKQPTVVALKWLILEDYVGFAAVSESAQNHNKCTQINKYTKTAHNLWIYVWETPVQKTSSSEHGHCSLVVFRARDTCHHIVYKGIQLLKKLSTFWAKLKNKKKTGTKAWSVTVHTHPNLKCVMSVTAEFWMLWHFLYLSNQKEF